ncbi:MAG: hypothetical protein A3H50_03655 [Candidatus Levybacteria bacterium RIFCSPLOWO2_02_FULL_37_10]|nr:MAG: hypothetical protein A2860_01940 [Candidatus Levybacteria bacterium RIFCSPHIGHO2_01_FULL_37_33]OGH29783.1 MAG: hypothetical protein A3F30_01200 [Candidatus Levybacteria bacterium RIFCSPHIGHO2_12_FULL_37_12]OGH32627.1 MAG: hypothetical protein A2953_01195 [Candidatus Levybacteria bacterium RIFCSPLOWO2_01_FULL_36_54]OGH43968.1 MAG: hypothetical protein A3H50_03655 [Candidatus Levybacteria bacterium RIFCSPLOWO2_02_FULL_37_10]
MNKKILIIEDEKPAAKAMEIKLKKAGYEVKAVLNGDEGLKELEKGRYDLVILDILMPVIDGWSVLEKIKEKGIKVKVIIVSNLSQPEDKKRAMELGASDYMVKTDSTLANIVDRVQSFLYPS